MGAEFLVIGAVNKKLKAKRAVYVWCLLQIFLIGLLPSLQAIHNHTVFTIICIAVYSIIRSADSGAWTSIVIFLQNSVSKEDLPLSFGCATAVRRITEGLLSGFLGSLFAISISYEAEHRYNVTRGFPFNHNITFYLISLAAFFTCILAFFIKDDIDQVDR